MSMTVSVVVISAEAIFLQVSEFLVNFLRRDKSLSCTSASCLCPYFQSKSVSFLETKEI